MKKYRISAKRKENYRLTYSIYDFYYMYNEENKTNISKDLYIAISKEFNKELIENKMIKNRKRINLSYGLGVIRVAKTKKHRCKLVNFNATKSSDKVIYHTNLHTNGALFSFYWEKIRSLHNSAIYQFKVKKQTRRLLSKEIRDCANNPYVSDYDALPR